MRELRGVVGQPSTRDRRLNEAILVRRGPLYELAVGEGVDLAVGVRDGWRAVWGCGPYLPLLEQSCEGFLGQ